ncbi:hypothetical protein [Hyphococcus sp.]|uniref:hypothetical protein n=1 Tax=Hyphococcus sp. TaxID=2038636 RepID=UPI0035C6FF47
MPENEDKSQDRQTAAPKKPDGKAKSGAKSADREARLAEALRANLRRRKASDATETGSTGGVKETKEE